MSVEDSQPLAPDGSGSVEAAVDDDLQTIGWSGDAAHGVIDLIDQTRLPTEFVRIDCRDVPAVWEAIRSLRVRGARPSASPPPMGP